MSNQKADILQGFSTILFKATRDRARFYSTPRPNLNEPILERPDQAQLIDEQVLLLGKLYLSLDGGGRELLVELAKSVFDKTSPWSRYSGQAFVFLARFCDFDVAIDGILATLEADDHGWHVAECIADFLRHDHVRITDTKLKALTSELLKRNTELRRPEYEKPAAGPRLPTASETAYRRTMNTLNRIIGQVQEIKYHRLRASLIHDVNLEVNQDKERLAEELKRFGFPEKLVESLEHAEREYRKAESGFQFKNACDHNRSFFEILLQQVAERVASSRNERLPVNPAKPVEIREYLKDSGFLPDRFHKLCEAFYQFASDESAHKLSSGREVARIVRNMNIELALLLIRRLGGYAGGQP